MRKIVSLKQVDPLELLKNRWYFLIEKKDIVMKHSVSVYMKSKLKGEKSIGNKLMAIIPCTSKSEMYRYMDPKFELSEKSKNEYFMRLHKTQKIGVYG